MLVLALVVGGGCSKKSSPEPAPEPAIAPAGSPLEPAPAQAGAVGDAGVAPVAAPIDEIAARFLDAWLGAQNDGDFAAYSALYAPELHGVRRSGSKVKSFDRKGWLADRRRMFSRPMEVEIEGEPIVRGRGDAITIELVQVWRSGTYADKGPKRIELAPVPDRPGQYLVTREEMLASNLIGTHPTCKDAVLAHVAETDEDFADRVTSESILTPARPPRAVCMLVAEDTSGGEIVLGVTAGEHGARRLLAVAHHTYDTEVNDDQGIDEGAEARIKQVEISRHELALWFEIERRRDEPGVTRRSSETILYRLGGDLELGWVTELEELVSARSSSTIGEVGAGDEHEVEITDELHGDFYDVVVHTTRYAESYPSGERETEERSSTRYRWNGRAYVPR